MVTSAIVEDNVAVPVIEQAKIQAQILVPLVKALQTELGKERAQSIVRRAIGDIYRRLGEEWWKKRKSTDVGTNMASAFISFAKGSALDYKVREHSRDAYQTDGFASDVKITRTQTIMQGASHCDFRYQRRNG